MRLRYIGLIVVAILVAPFLAFWAWSAVEARRLDRALDALEARHEPLDLVHFDPQPATDEQRQASHFYKQAIAQLTDLRPRWLTELGKVIQDYCGTSDPATRTGREASLKSFEDRYRPALELLDTATQLDANGWDPKDRPSSTSIETNLPYELAQVNAVRVARLACGGEADEAANALLASLRLQRMLPRWARRFLTSDSAQLVLRAGASPPLLRRLQQEYERQAADFGLEIVVQHVRAQWLYFGEPGVFSDPPPGYETQRMTPLQAIAIRLLRPASDHAAVSELHEFDEAMDAVSHPWPQKLDAVRALDRKYPRPSNRGSVVPMFVRAMGRHAAINSLQIYADGVAETLARTRATIGALAVARWRADHGGALPASLRELVPSYVSAPLLDPYTGDELKYVIKGDRYKVYSVGANRTDEGGVWDQTSDLQRSRRGNPLDIGIAVNQN